MNKHRRTTLTLLLRTTACFAVVDPRRMTAPQADRLHGQPHIQFNP